ELAASDYSGATPDRGIEPLEQALADLYAGRWERAARRLQKVIEVAEDPHVAARAQEFLRVCTARMAAAEPSPEDPYLQAVVARNEGDLTTALEIAGQRKFHKDPRHAYLTAALHASRGELEQAAAALERALELEPRYR